MRIKLNLIFSLLLALTIIEVSSTAWVPKPYCLSRPMYKEFPLTSEELVTYDMSQSFSGFNLNITLGKESDVASIGRKWSIIDRVNQSFPNIISHYVETRHNTVGR